MSLCSLSDVKSYLNIVDNSMDTFLNSAILKASQIIVDICKQNIESGTNNMIWICKDSPYLWFREFPVISVTKLEIGTFDTTFETIVSTLYELAKVDNIYYLYYYPTFAKGQFAKVEFVSGYTTIPESIEQVAIEMIARMYKESELRAKSGGGELGKSSIAESINGITGTTIFKDLMPKWKDMLKKYIKPTI